MNSTTYLSRKRHRSPSNSSTSSQEYPSYINLKRERSDSPNLITQDNDLILDDTDLGNGLHLEEAGIWTQPPHKKRRRDLRKSLERLKLKEHSGKTLRQWTAPVVDTQPFPPHFADFSAHPPDAGPSTAPVYNQVGPQPEEYDGQLRLDDLGKVIYPKSVESPEEKARYDWKHPLSPSRESGIANENAMTEDVTSLLPIEVGITNPSSAQRIWKAPKTYEPTKDRIIVTSLSDSDTDSNPFVDEDSDEILELPPNPSDDLIDSPSFQSHIQQQQPGSQGFVISPSFLQRINQMSTQERDIFRRHFGLGKPQNGDKGKGLVLYRNLPNINANGVWPNTVQEDCIQGAEINSGRFEMLPDEDQDAEMEIESPSRGMEDDIGAEDGMDVDG